MTFEWSHRKLKTFNKALKPFEEQIRQTHPGATLCYHNRYSKFTVSLYVSVIPDLKPINIETEHVNIISSIGTDTEIEKLAQDLSKFIMNH